MSSQLQNFMESIDIHMINNNKGNRHLEKRKVKNKNKNKKTTCLLPLASVSVAILQPPMFKLAWSQTNFL